MAEKSPFAIYRTEAPIRHPNKLVFEFLLGFDNNEPSKLKEQLQSSGRLRLVTSESEA
jgi:hypothetical protein